MRSITTDQGTEIDLVDAPFVLQGSRPNESISELIARMAPASGADEQGSLVRSYMYPIALQIPGHLHMMYDALEGAVKKLPAYADFITHLRALQSFMSNGDLRRRFQVVCMRGLAAAKMFDHYSVVHIDWRWEFLSLALDRLLPVMPLLRAHFDLEKMAASGDKNTLSAGVLSDASKALKVPNFVEFAEMIRVKGKALQHRAHWLEGCWCHEHIWKARGRRHNAKRRRLIAETGHTACPWKGARGAEFAVNGLEVLVRAVQEATSQELQESLSHMEPGARGEIVALQARSENPPNMFLHRLGPPTTHKCKYLGCSSGRLLSAGTRLPALCVASTESMFVVCCCAALARPLRRPSLACAARRNWCSGWRSSSPRSCASGA